LRSAIRLTASDNSDSGQPEQQLGAIKVPWAAAGAGDRLRVGSLWSQSRGVCS